MSGNVLTGESWATARLPISQGNLGRGFLSRRMQSQPSLVAALVLAREAAGGLVKVELGEVREIAGVVAAFTAEDLPEVLIGTAAAPPNARLDNATDTPLLAREPRYYGDAVGVVIAKTERTARSAARAASVQAVGSRAKPTSRDVCRAQIGDIKQTRRRIRDSRHRASISVEIQAVSHLCLESHACLAIPNADGGRLLEVWSNTQAPEELRRILCESLGLPMSRVRVRKFAEGGGFGAKQEVYDEPLVAWLALTLGEPVQLRYRRDEDLARSRTRHAATLNGSVGTSPNGDLLGITLDGRAFGGAYLSHTPYVIGDLVSTPSYTYGKTVYAGRCVGTVDRLRTPAGAYRGYGAPQATFLVEQLVDEAALMHGLDPIDYRIEQLQAGLGRPDLFEADSTDRLINLMRKVRERVSWDAWQGQGATNRGLMLGKGVAIATMLNALGFDRLEESLAIVRINADGSVQVASPAVDCGTGSSRAFATMVADTFGIRCRDITVIEGDTDLSITDVGSYSQRSVYVGGGAVIAAARDALARLQAEAAFRYGCRPDEVAVIGDGLLRCKSDEVRIADIARSAIGDGHPIVGFGRYKPVGQSATYGVWMIQVSVSPLSGAIAVERLAVGVDCGTQIVPGAVRGQIIGGAIQGLSNTLHEVGNIPGRPPPASIGEHGVIRAPFAPDVDVVTLDVSADRGPGGAKGVGEIGIVGVPAAIANAVHDAVGWRPTRLPITPQDVWAGALS